MKNTAINTLQYTGIVTLSQYIGTNKVQVAKYHNAGGNVLFNFLYDCLAGSYDALKRPTKIMLLTQIAGDTGYTYEPASGFIYLRTAPVKDTVKKQSCVRLSFVMPRDLFETLNAESMYLGLYAHNAVIEDPDIGEKYMAICALDYAPSNLQNASLIVDWELTVANNNSNVSANKTIG